MAKVLLVDDDELVRYALTKVLRKAGHEVIDTDKTLKVSMMIQKEIPDILITDIVMPDQDGIGLIREVRKLSRTLPIIAISGGGRLINVGYLDTAKVLGANAVLAKPFDNDKFLSLVEELTRPQAE